MIGRHSKSLDTNKFRCGSCTGKIEFLGKYNQDGSKCKARKANKFALYVKLHYNTIKATHGSHLTHGEIMKLLSKNYKNECSYQHTYANN